MIPDRTTGRKVMRLTLRRLLQPFPRRSIPVLALLLLLSLPLSARRADDELRLGCGRPYSFLIINSDCGDGGQLTGWREEVYVWDSCGRLIHKATREGGYCEPGERGGGLGAEPENRGPFAPRDPVKTGTTRD